jgi:FkbM family methyltransferase
MVLSVFPEARILMIEPQREMQMHLDQLCRENQNLEFIHAAAGRESGQLVQTIWEDLAGSSFLPEPSEEKLQTGKQRITRIVTIDNLTKDRSEFFPDLVKLDIQGFELEALKGSTSLFSKTQVFILETSLYEFIPNMPITLDCINFMAARGYELHDVAEYRRRPLDGALGQIDLAFVLRDGVFRRSRLWEVNPRS